MELEIWLEWYREILDDFGFSREDDEASALFLNEFLKNHQGLSLKDLPSGDNFIVFGAGPSLKTHVKALKKIDLNEYILISADGATSALLEEDLVPDIIVTDLDGKIDDLLEANSQGAYMVVHAHGNNLENLEKYLGKLERVLGTTQSIPLEHVHDFGGFTDGDRAVFLAVELGAQKIIMAGMDFGDVVTKYSRPDMEQTIGPADEIKKMKLEYAEKLIEWIIDYEDVSIFNLSNPEDFKKVFE
jgi:2-amino-4-hydroxy-6-hydroxymethyldihydropteridine diphosphokinase